MEKVPMNEEVSKAAKDVGAALVVLVGACKDALADGFQPMQDIPAVVAQAAGGVIAAVGDVGKLGGEHAEDAKAVELPLASALIDIKAILLKKAAPVDPLPPAA